MKNHLKNTRHNKGFTLIEVLIAMVILAVGVLGVVALQFQALRFNHDAYLRTQISVLASDIMDQIRLNSSNAGDYVADYTVGDATGACDLTVPASAANDLACWRQQLIQTLPPGSEANITSAGSMYTISLVWTDRENQERTISYTLQP